MWSKGGDGGRPTVYNSGSLSSVYRQIVVVIICHEDVQRRQRKSINNEERLHRFIELLLVNLSFTFKIVFF